MLMAHRRRVDPSWMWGNSLMLSQRHPSEEYEDGVHGVRDVEWVKLVRAREVSANMGKKLDIAASAVPANMARQETSAGFAKAALMDGFDKIAASACHVPTAD